MVTDEVVDLVGDPADASCGRALPATGASAGYLPIRCSSFALVGGDPSTQGSQRMLASAMSTMHTTKHPLAKASRIGRGVCRKSMKM